jgi:transposase
MKSMIISKSDCQAVPNSGNGIVIGVDISKGKIDYGAFRNAEKSKLYRSIQNADGYGEFKSFVDALILEGYDPWIAFEPTGPYSVCFREWLQRNEMRLVQVNPYHVKRTKEVRDNSPEKTDFKDPRVIADLVWQGCYQELQELTEEYAELRCAIAEWASLTKKRTALRNEFQCLLEVWFPELRDIFKDAVCKSVRGIIRKYANPDDIASSRITSIRCTLKKATSGRMTHKAEEIKLAAKHSIAAKLGQQARRNAMLFLLDHLEMVESRREQLKCEMDTVLQTMRIAQCLLSIPRLGVISVAGLLGECGDIGQFDSYASLEKYVGLNLFEVSSGKHKGQKHISKRGRALARYLICHMAIIQIKTGGLYDTYSNELKAQGKKAGQIRIAVARKLLQVIFAIARDLSEFDPQQYAKAKAEDGLVIQQGTRQVA